MRRQRTPEMQSPHLLSMICGLMKDPYQPVTRHRMKPLISLISHKKRDAIGNPNYRTLGMEKPRATTAHKVYPGPSTTPIIEDWPSYPPLQQLGEDMVSRGLLNSVSRRLDDMLSTPFISLIINYKPPRAFIVQKFSAYDGSNDPFDHIMHYR